MYWGEWRAGKYEAGGTTFGLIDDLERLNWIWTACRVVDECKQMVRQGKEKYRLEERPSAYFEYFRQYENWIELTLYGCILSVAVFRRDAIAGQAPRDRAAPAVVRSTLLPCGSDPAITAEVPQTSSPIQKHRYDMPSTTGASMYSCGEGGGRGGEGVSGAAGGLAPAGTTGTSAAAVLGAWVSEVDVSRSEAEARRR